MAIKEALTRNRGRWCAAEGSKVILASRIQCLIDVHVRWWIGAVYVEAVIGKALTKVTLWSGDSHSLRLDEQQTVRVREEHI